MPYIVGLLLLSKVGPLSNSYFFTRTASAYIVTDIPKKQRM